MNYLLFCDAATRSTDGKAILHGVFDVIFAVKQPTDQDPAIHPTMALAFEIKDLNKKVAAVKIRIQHVDTKKNVYETKIDTPKSLESRPRVSGIVNLHMLKFPLLGKYVAELFVNDELVGQNDIEVKLQA